MNRVLLIDTDEGHARALTERLRSRNLTVERVTRVEEAVRLLRSGFLYDLVILDVSQHRQDWLAMIRQLQHASIQSGHPFWCRILCLSRRLTPADFVLKIERIGCRYVFER